MAHDGWNRRPLRLWNLQLPVAAKKGPTPSPATQPQRPANRFPLRSSFGSTRRSAHSRQNNTTYNFGGHFSVLRSSGQRTVDLAQIGVLTRDIHRLASEISDIAHSRSDAEMRTYGGHRLLAQEKDAASEISSVAGSTVSVPFQSDPDARLIALPTEMCMNEAHYGSAHNVVHVPMPMPLAEAKSNTHLPRSQRALARKLSDCKLQLLSNQSVMDDDIDNAASSATTQRGDMEEDVQELA